MVQELQLARRMPYEEQRIPDLDPGTAAVPLEPTRGLSPCQHRTVSKDGRIICSKIVEGEGEVSPNICRSCPYKQVNCAHLRFSLRQTSASPLIVRYNGRTEVWNDGPPELRFEHAACMAKVTPVYEPRSCEGCTLHKALQPAADQPRRRRSNVIGAGKVVAFPSREPVAATS
jgi:hypothetical protein